jgi:hypothetical protein
LRKHGRTCKDLKFFKDCRDALRKFTPPPSDLPDTPKGWEDYDLLTSAEKQYVLNVEADVFAKAMLLDSAKFSVGIRSACWPGGGWIVRWPDRSNGPSASS